eukprot:m.119727 g.119727  ORF g.119727 m.119727 type:complete len:219 (+) comp11034_c0_seq1:2359-3015(+)
MRSLSSGESFGHGPPGGCIPPPPIRSTGASSIMKSEAFAPLSMSPSKLAAKVDALQKKLMGGSAQAGQMGSFSFKLNSASAKQPLAEGQFSGIMPWKMTEDAAMAQHHEQHAEEASVPKSSTLHPERPPLVRGGSFTIKPKRRRVTSDMDDALELAVHSATSGMEDPLVDTYLDICFDDSVTEDASTVLSLDHDEYADLIKAFEIDTNDVSKLPDLMQ